MPTVIQSRLIRLNGRLYGRLLIFYPRELRGRFGDEMAQVFQDQLFQAAHLRGLLGMTLLWCTALWELLTVATPARLQSTAVIAGAISFLASSAMFLAILGTVK